ncbi:assimilatory sulfite reductase (NADPH) flavoprotein subunit [Alteromonas sp. 5E99-2]|uniref:assimilatory sulfite reductase (NADPH) flavoprotein subunit n=1 Tax=Alteromonas sp. 5E99-2 TaxID=2817683 RepID=UPI001A97FE4B|nr:assimilatory sulfite reductase (NADPH) flavoprotein subunit [Alteromonas sp. 5E99-2]MBO1254481.1 assimilatory sulfite reductase (NADPH) flavoprotein subunit [Alteromonas sp. 5E99-2]
MSNQNQTPKNGNTLGVVAPQQLSVIAQAVAGLDASQLTWVSGYLAGLAQAGGSVSAQPANQVAAAGEQKTFTILYGSQTGNAKGVAAQLHSAAEAKGITCKLVSMADYKARQIKNETHLAVVVSTHGEGEAPDDAMELHEFLASKKAPKLANTQYAVLGLGDTSYEFFCQTAKDFDQRLEKLGAKAALPRVDCDVDYETASATWIEELLSKIQDELKAESSAPVAAATSVSGADAVQTYTKKAPFAASLATVQKITGRDSVKDIQHIEISLEDSGIQYQAGDALGVWFKNDAAIVAEIIELTKTNGDDSVTVAGSELSLTEALTAKLELTLSYPGFVTAYQDIIKNDALQDIISDKAKLRTYLDDRQIIDVVREYPGQLTAEQLASALRPLTPRLYSIASSQAEVEDEVHLTIAHVDYTAFDKRHQGGASGYLCSRLEEGDTVEVYIEPNQHFRLPENPETPIIMVGPGTGIAPFRSFIQDRDAQGASGENWLFFGNPSFTQDFLYQTEWQGYKKSGLLTRLTLAFSRDQEQKIYVQHRLAEHGEEVYKWLEKGAHFYVCGDANHMAKDVEQALIDLVAKYGNKSDEEAKQYVVALRKAKRYQKDVY